MQRLRRDPHDTALGRGARGTIGRVLLAVFVDDDVDGARLLDLRERRVREHRVGVRREVAQVDGGEAHGGARVDRVRRGGERLARARRNAPAERRLRRVVRVFVWLACLAHERGDDDGQVAHDE